MQAEVIPGQCPLVTTHTAEWNIPASDLEKLFVLRSWNPEVDGAVPWRWPSHLRTHIYSVVHECETTHELVPRNYQLQMAHHLARMPRFICGDSVGLGKTLDAIMACCWLHDRSPKQKVIVIATKSTAMQWADEFRRFSTLRTHLMQDKYGNGKNAKKSYEARFSQLRDFLENDDHDVLICKYSSLIGTRRKVEGRFDDEGRPVHKGKELISQEVKRFASILEPHGSRITLICDEAHKFKGASSQTRVMVQVFAHKRNAARAWAMTATAIQNNLEEFYSIANAIHIRPFGSIMEFRDDFCIYETVTVSARGQEKAVLKGYRNVPRFRNGMRPFFFGRSQAQVKEPLPRLSTLIHPIDLSDEQARLLLVDIPSGEFRLPPSLVKDKFGGWHEKERSFENEMTAFSVYQLVANHPGLLDPGDPSGFFTRRLSPKEETLLDMLDGDFRGEKVIVFTRFRSWIDRLQKITSDGFFTSRKFLRITGAESDVQRAEAKRLFQEPDSGYDLIFVNTAAIEGVNLQQAAHLICLDLPFGFGAFSQLVGRMVRMGSPHAACTLHILSARGTLDEFAIAILKSKKGIFEAILGESFTAGILDDREGFRLDSGMEADTSDEELYRLMRAHAKSVRMRTFLEGEALAEAQAQKTGSERVRKVKKPGRKLDDVSLTELALKWE